LSYSHISISAVLASFLLKEELGHIGRVGCALCLLGSLIIVLHAPDDKEITTVDEILHFALQPGERNLSLAKFSSLNANRPGFMLYCFTVTVFSALMIFAVVPRYGRTNPVIYISICSLVGSVSVMSIKGFGVAVKLTFAGNNQFTHPSTYVFGIVTALCIVIQMNYFNKALDTFSTNVYVSLPRPVPQLATDPLHSVNPMYYVGFSSATIVASLILFQGFNTTDGTNTLSLLCGFIVTFLGVHLLNLSRKSADGEHHSALESGITNPRLSLQGRMSIDGWNGVAGTPIGAHQRRQSSLSRSHGTVIFEDGVDEGMALSELPEADEDDYDDANERTRLRNPQDTRRIESRSHSHSPSLSQAERRLH
jgi:hypothetical protein